jgi:hypothetical protein
MTEEWVQYWSYLLMWNADYDEYMTARKSGDVKKCRALEGRFERVAEIYEDFGYVDIVFPMPEQGLIADRWQRWFTDRKHLFMAPAEVIAPGQLAPDKAGHITLSIPLRETADETAAKVAEFLTSHYQNADVVSAKPPKYTLWEDESLGIAQVRKACIVAQGWNGYDEDGEPLDSVRRITYFARLHLDMMKWSIDPKAKKALDAGRALPIERFNSYKQMYYRSWRHAKALARNTIRGRFPDTTPFESRSIWDASRDL